MCPQGIPLGIPFWAWIWRDADAYILAQEGITGSRMDTSRYPGGQDPEAFRPLVTWNGPGIGSRMGPFWGTPLATAEGVYLFSPARACG